MKLMREVRCFPLRTDQSAPHPADGGEAFWTIRTVVEGPVDRQTGYVFDIKAIDRLIGDRVIPQVVRERESGGGTSLGAVVFSAFHTAAGGFRRPVALESLQVLVSGQLAFLVERDASDMVQLTQSFEFCAAHRLHCREFSDEENARVFGPCSNANWHGHNYRLEVTVSGTPDGRRGTIIDPPELERIVRANAIEPFDHKNLNLECEDFAELNPSVENIARVIWKRLEGAFGRAGLRSVRVWETSKTYAEYAGE